MPRTKGSKNKVKVEDLPKDAVIDDVAPVILKSSDIELVELKQAKDILFKYDIDSRGKLERRVSELEK